jgi:hypothetical protein
VLMLQHSWDVMNDSWLTQHASQAPTGSVEQPKGLSNELINGRSDSRTDKNIVRQDIDVIGALVVLWSD